MIHNFFFTRFLILFFKYGVRPNLIFIYYKTQDIQNNNNHYYFNMNFPFQIK
jgi:hypothetical protein